MSSKFEMKGYITASLFVFLFGLTACSKKPATDKLALLTKRENKHFPQRLNDSIVIDSTTFDKATNTKSYFYTVSRGLDDRLFITGNYVSMYNALKEAVRNSVEMRDYLNAHSTIRYVYYSKSTRQQLAEFKF